MTTTCSICGGKHFGRGWCNKHYARWRRHGDPHATPGPRRGVPPADRVLDRCVPGPGDCWLFTGNFNGDGYGQISDGLTSALVHRVVWEYLVGPIPDGLTLDHLCRVRNCVNVAHLEPVPHRVNVLRGNGFSAVNARKTHCGRGHEFTAENTYRQPSRPEWRRCRECRRLQTAYRKKVLA